MVFMKNTASSLDIPWCRYEHSPTLAPGLRNKRILPILRGAYQLVHVRK